MFLNVDANIKEELIMSDVTEKDTDDSLLQALIIILIIMALSFLISLSVFFMLFFILT